ncbi:hypothetical protein V2G26_010240 [Clonostachys chloroleuca]
MVSPSRDFISSSAPLGKNNSWTFLLQWISRARHSTLISHHSDRQMWRALLVQLRQDDDLNESTFSPARCLRIAALRTFSDRECLQACSADGYRAQGSRAGGEVERRQNEAIQSPP